MLLIGSHALLHYIPSIGRRPPDIDVIATFDELGGLTSFLKRETRVESIPFSANKTVLRCQDGRIVEVELAWEGTAARALLQRSVQNGNGYHPVSDFASDNGWSGLMTRLATLDELYTLKMSHRYLKNSPHFRKTRRDIMAMREMGARVFDESWLRQREDETYVYKHPKLNVMKKDFFTGDGVQYVYDHDDIHKAVAHLTDSWTIFGVPINPKRVPQIAPAYTFYMKDGEEVKSDRAKFFAIPEKVRLYGVLEEAQVLALERSQIPFRGKVDPRRSFDIALEKVCTSITSGWFREFAWENLDRIEAMYEADYVDRFWRAVDDGRVRKL